MTPALEPVVIDLDEHFDENPNRRTERRVSHLSTKSITDHYENYNQVVPTEEELMILPRVAGTIPWSAYILCVVEFAERSSFYGCNNVLKNFIRAPLPEGGNGAGAPPRGSQKTAGALGKGTVIAGAMTDSFKFMAYAM